MLENNLLAEYTRIFTGLRNWDQDDLPEVEHYRWSPSCSFINQLLLEGTRKEVRCHYFVDKDQVNSKPTCTAATRRAQMCHELSAI